MSTKPRINTEEHATEYPEKIAVFQWGQSWVVSTGFCDQAYCDTYEEALDAAAQLVDDGAILSLNKVECAV